MKFPKITGFGAPPPPITPPPARRVPAVTHLDPQFLVQVAEEVWRLNRRLERAEQSVGVDPLKGLRDSTGRLVDVLTRNGVVTDDHLGALYRDGMRLEVAHVEGNPAEDQPLWITETVKPTVRLKEHVLSPGQVILGTQPPVGTSE